MGCRMCEETSKPAIEEATWGGFSLGVFIFPTVVETNEGLVY